MNKYRVGLTQKVYEGATVFVEAASQELAEKLAMETCYGGACEWEFIETAEGAEIVSVELVKESTKTP